MNRDRPISLSGMRGFLAAVKHLSFTAAAVELHLSQSALSRQIQGLEAELGKALFLRNARRVTLTPAGEELARAARAGLKTIDDGVTRIRAVRQRRSVSVTTFASLASLWLIPRLSVFAASHADVDVNCIAADRAIDLLQEDIDVALRAMPKPPPGADCQLMFEDMIIPVCGAALAEQGRVPRRVADLTAQTLLRMDEATERSLPWLSWDHWLEQAGAGDLNPRANLRFSNFDQVIQAALSGQGVALARAPLVVELLLQKRLLTPLGSVKLSGRGYYLITSEASRQRQEVRDFIKWIGEEAAQTRELLKRATRDIGRAAAS